MVWRLPLNLFDRHCTRTISSSDSVPDTEQQLEGVSDDVVHGGAQEQSPQHLARQGVGQVLRDADGGPTRTGVVCMMEAQVVLQSPPTVQLRVLRQHLVAPLTRDDQVDVCAT